MPLPMCLVIVEQELLIRLISSNFQNSVFYVITITVTEIDLIQVLFFTVGCKQKNKNENTEYHDTFTPFKAELDLKQGKSIFLLFRSWRLVLYLHVLVKSKVMFW